MSGTSSKRVYVGNLPHSGISEDDVKSHFGKIGSIVKIDLKQGYGFVEFESQREADDAIHQLDGKEIFGKPIRVEASKGTPRGRGGVKTSSPPPQRMRSHNAREPRRGGSGYKVSISKLKDDVSWQSLKDYFRKFGDVMYADVDRKGYGTVEFARYDDMKQAIKKCDGADVLGSYIGVRESEDRGRADRRRYSPYHRSSGSSRRRRSYSGSPRRSRRDSRSRSPYRSSRRHSSRSPRRSRSRSPKYSSKSNSGSSRRHSKSRSPVARRSPAAAATAKRTPSPAHNGNSKHRSRSNSQGRKSGSPAARQASPQAAAQNNNASPKSPQQ